MGTEGGVQAVGLQTDGAGLLTTSPDMTAGETTRWIGGRLRSIRQQKQLSMLDVDRLSNGDFGPSTIGAYERGDRTISLDRLERLARFYGVSVQQFLPRSADESWTSTRTSPIEERLTINLVELRAQTSEMFGAMGRYVELIRQQRHDSHPRIITLRGTDALVFAAMLGVPVDRVIAELDEYHLLFRGTPETA